LLLIHSLERSFRAMAARVLPHLDSEAAQKWAWCAFHALGDRDAQALRRELPALLQAADEGLLDNLAPTRQTVVTPKAPLHVPAEPVPGLSPEPESARGELPGATAANLSACHTGSFQASPIAGSPPELSACHTGSSQVSPTAGPPPELSAWHTGSFQVTSTAGPPPELSARHTGSFQAPPAAVPPPESPYTGFGHPSGDTALESGEFPGHRKERDALSWSPVPWPRAAASQDKPRSAPQSTTEHQPDARSQNRTACHTGLCHAHRRAAPVRERPLQCVGTID
jgi:hypothetical protein